MMDAMEQVHKITTLDNVWQPGDVVLDATGTLRVRSNNPRWTWDYPEGATRAIHGGPYIPDGATEDNDVPRPLILLVRNGQAVGGIVVTE